MSNSEATIPVGVIVVNWNGVTDTIACLESLMETRPRPLHVVVVDNGSADDSVARLVQWSASAGVELARVSETESLTAEPRSWLTLVESSRNRGSPGGNNLGWAMLERWPEVEYFFLLNNDATIAPDFLARLVDVARSMPNAGVLTGTIYEYAPPHRIWYSGGRLRPWRGLVEHVVEPPPSREPRATDFISGCAMLITRPACRAVGLYAERYHPIYFEDAEYSARAIAAGFTLVYVPEASAYHKVGATVGAPKVSPFVAYNANRNRAFYIRRNFRGLERIVALGYLVVTKPGRALVEALRGKPKFGWAILSGAFAGLTQTAADP